MGQVVKIALQADVGGFVRNFANAEGAVGKLGATFEGVTKIVGATTSAINASLDAITGAAKKMALAGASGVASFTAMGVAAAGFEAKMANVATISNVSTAQFGRMGEEVLKMSTRFPNSAQDIAEGLYNIVSSGKQGAEAMRILEVSTVAASAGLTSVQSAGTAIMAVLNAYGKSASEAADVSDILFQTVNLGVVNFEQLTGVIGDVVGTAAAAGVAIEEVGAAIATMTLSGISADEAGTSLNRVLQSLIDPSEALGSAFAALGYENGQTAIEADGLRGVIDRLREASQGNLNTLMAWFPEIRAARGALALMSAEGENYSRVAAGIEDKQARAGASLKAFNLQSETTVQAWGRLRNSMHAFAISLGTHLLPAAKLFIEMGTGLVNVFNDLPAPIKGIITWVGMLGSVFTVVAGLIVAFGLKAMLMRFAMQKVSEAMIMAGLRAGDAGRGFAAAGARMGEMNGPFAFTRYLMSELREGIRTTGNRMVDFGNTTTKAGMEVQRSNLFMGAFRRTIGTLGQGFGLLNTAMGKVGTGLANMTRYIPVAIGAFIALFSAWSQGRSKAQQFADAMTEGFDANSPKKAIKDIQDVQKEFSKVQQKMAADTQSVGGFLSQWGKNIADIATNIVGADIITDSSWDQYLKSDELSKTEKKMVKDLRNFQKNMQDVVEDLDPKRKGTAIDLGSEEIGTFALIAKRAGVDLTNSFEKSGPARQRALNEIRETYNAILGMGGGVGVVSEGMIKDYEKIIDASDKAGKAASEAFDKSFDLFGTVEEKTKDGAMSTGQAIKEFYFQSVLEAQGFYNNIQDLMARGANPALIAKFLQAGPQAAGGVVRAAVEDSTGGLIEVLNKGESALAGFSNRAAAMARLTQRAIMAPTDELAMNLSAATVIQNEVFQQGNLATTDTVAKALSMDAASVRLIASQFGITLADTLATPAIPLVTTKPQQAEQLKEFFRSIVAETNGPRAALAGVTNQLQDIMNMKPGPEQNLALKDLLDTIYKIDGLSGKDRSFIVHLINVEMAQQKMREFLDTWNQGATPLSQESKDFLITVSGQPDAVEKVKQFAFFAGLTPQERNLLLEVVGHPEAMEDLRTVEEKAKEVEDVDPTVHIGVADSATNVVNALLGRMRDLDGDTATVTIREQILTAGGNPAAAYGGGNPFAPQANGGILRFADGGEHHIAQYAKAGDWRLWAEPETGGESYIPWALGKRKRSTAVLAATADAFGYGLVPMAAGGIWGGSANSGGGGLTINTELVFNGPVNGDSQFFNQVTVMMDERDRKLVNNLRRKRE